MEKQQQRITQSKQAKQRQHRNNSNNNGNRLSLEAFLQQYKGKRGITQGYLVTSMGQGKGSWTIPFDKYDYFLQLVARDIVKSYYRHHHHSSSSSTSTPPPPTPPVLSRWAFVENPREQAKLCIDLDLYVQNQSLHLDLVHSTALLCELQEILCGVVSPDCSLDVAVIDGSGWDHNKQMWKISYHLIWQDEQLAMSVKDMKMFVGEVLSRRVYHLDELQDKITTTEEVTSVFDLAIYKTTNVHTVQLRIPYTDKYTTSKREWAKRPLLFKGIFTKNKKWRDDIYDISITIDSLEETLLTHLRLSSIFVHPQVVTPSNYGRRNASSTLPPTTTTMLREYARITPTTTTSSVSTTTKENPTSSKSSRRRLLQQQKQNTNKRRERRLNKETITSSSPLFKELSKFIYAKYNFNLHQLHRCPDKQSKEAYIYFGHANNRTIEDRYCPNKGAAHGNSHTYVSINNRGYIQQYCLSFKTYHGINCRDWKGKSYMLPQRLLRQLFPNNMRSDTASTTATTTRRSLLGKRKRKRKRILQRRMSSIVGQEKNSNGSSSDESGDNNNSDDDGEDDNESGDTSTPSSKRVKYSLKTPSQILEKVGNIKPAIGNMASWGHVLLIAGDPGVGKSTLCLTLIAGYLQGEWMPNVPVCDDTMSGGGGKVLYVLPEGFAEQLSLWQHWNVIPDVDQYVRILEMSLIEGMEDLQFQLNEKNRTTFRECCTTYCPKVIVIDGLRAILDGDENSSQCVGTLLQFLNQIAEEHKALLLLTHHLRKGLSLSSSTTTTTSTFSSSSSLAPTIHDIRGSSALIAACRSVWVIYHPDKANNPEWKQICVCKNNSGPTGTTVDFHLKDPQGGITFPPPSSSSDQQRDDERLLSSPRTQRNKAEKWLLNVLQEYGPTSWNDIVDILKEEEEEGEYQGQESSVLQVPDSIPFSESTLKRARKELKREGKIVYNYRQKTWQYVEKTKKRKGKEKIVDDGDSDDDW